MSVTFTALPRHPEAEWFTAPIPAVASWVTRRLPQIGANSKQATNPEPGGSLAPNSTKSNLTGKGIIRGLDGLPNERFPDAKERFESSFTRIKARICELARSAE